MEVCAAQEQPQPPCCQPVPMDALLEKLRNGMCELSSQGDDFTKQMWNMYATFEGLISGSPGEDGAPKRLPTPPGPVAAAAMSSRGSTLDRNFAVALSSFSSSNCPSAAVVVASSGQEKPTPLPRKSVVSTPSVCDSVSDSSSATATNLLLDTISAVTSSDQYSDSDDGSDMIPGQSAGSRVYQQQVRRKRHYRNTRLLDVSLRLSPNLNSSSDGDSIGYAGSNSIDSGYKSFCPTPEVTDMSGSDANALNSSVPLAGRRTDSSSAGMYAIKMATRLKNQQQDAQLDHLIHLRQSLIAAIQRCESSSSSTNQNGPESRTVSPFVSSRSSSPASTIVSKTRPARVQSPFTVAPSGGSLTRTSVQSLDHNRAVPRVRRILPPNPDCPPQMCRKPILGSKLLQALRTQQELASASSSNCSTPVLTPSVASSSTNSLNKSVRFDKDVSSDPGHHLVHVQVHSHPDQGLSLKSKSILKDPICEAMRSQMVRGEFGSGCPLEGEIDGLLYGKLPLTSGDQDGDCYGSQEDDVPYATMIEDKYKAKTAPSPSKDSQSSQGQELKVDLRTESPQDGPESDGPPKTSGQKREADRTLTRTPSSSRSRFTEMAKCMLDILDDLQVSSTSATSSSSSPEMASSLAPSASSSDEQLSSNSSAQAMSDDSEPNANCTPSAAILNGQHKAEPMLNASHINAILEKHLKKRAAKATASSVSSNLNSSSSSSCSYNTLPEYHIYEEVLYEALEPGTEVNGNLSLTGNRAKQRSNIYSLFSDSENRKSLCRSLGQEYRPTSGLISTDLDDMETEAFDSDHLNDDSLIVESEYGFKTTV
ncbi:hypothetical protein HDE_00412 [Halotydeus destructor]|nr:hypothetical protein HDE_00412 [Halotydeus destructor]